MDRDKRASIMMAMILRILMMADDDLLSYWRNLLYSPGVGDYCI